MVNRYAVLCGLASLLYSGQLRGQDIFIGMKGPTSGQLDLRASYANSNGTQAVTLNVFPKYWNDDLWLFANVPYRRVITNEGGASGIGDITLGGGPRIKAKNLSAFLYAAVALPTGVAPVGTGRTDVSTGLFTTIMPPGRAWEIDGLAEYTFTGRSKGAAQPNRMTAGALAGVRASRYARLAAGPNITSSGNNYSLGWQAAGRYAPSVRWHAHLRLNKSLKSRGIPPSSRAEFIVRYNL